MINVRFKFPKGQNADEAKSIQGKINARVKALEGIDISMGGTIDFELGKGNVLLINWPMDIPWKTYNPIAEIVQDIIRETNTKVE